MVSPHGRMEGPLNYHRRLRRTDWLEVACNRCKTRANLEYRRTPSAGCGIRRSESSPPAKKTATAIRGAITPNSSASSLVSTRGASFRAQFFAGSLHTFCKARPQKRPKSTSTWRCQKGDAA